MNTCLLCRSLSYLLPLSLTIIIYLSLDIISVYLKVGMYQGSVLSPLLFDVVMVVVSSDARSGLPSEFMYADDLVLMATIMEQVGRRVAEWRVIILAKD